MNGLGSNYRNEIVIYELSLNGAPVYIGSSYSLKDRLPRHKGKIDFDTCTVIDRCGVYERYDWEYMYIQIYKSWGFKLKNIADSRHFSVKNLKRNSPSSTRDIDSLNTR